MAFEDLSRRLERAQSQLWARKPDADLHGWIRCWMIGLGFLEKASTEARDASQAWQAHASQVNGELSGPALDAALSMLRANEVEQYHELALIALSQPLLEAIATWFLEAPTEVSGYPPGHRVSANWPTMLGRLDQEVSAPVGLVAAARLVEATLGTGRDRLVAHVAPGSINAGQLRSADGAGHWRGRIFLGTGPAREEALATLKELNSLLPPNKRSDESNIFELARDLLRSAGVMPNDWGARLQSVAVALGFQLEFAAAATHLVELVEAVVESDPAHGAADPSA